MDAVDASQEIPVETPSTASALPDHRVQRSAEFARVLAQCAGFHEFQERVSAVDRAARAAHETMGRVLGAIEAAVAPIRNAFESQAAVIDRFLERRRKHPDSVIDIAYSAACSRSGSMPDKARTQAVLAAFRHCKPVRRHWPITAKMTDDERVSVTAVAIRAIASMWIWHPELRRTLASAIARELRKERPHPKTRMDDRLDRDGCALASHRKAQDHADAVQVVPKAVRFDEEDPVVNDAIAGEIAQLVQGLAAKIRETDRGSAAAFDHLLGEDSRKAIAPRHGMTPRQVQCAEVRVCRKFESLRRHVQ